MTESVGRTAASSATGDRTTRRERLLWTAVLFEFAAITGIATQTRGALLVSFRREFGVSESLLGLVTPVSAVGFVAVALVFGLAAGRVNVHRWLLIGVTGMIAGFLLLAAAPNFPFLLTMIGLRSAARGACKALDRPLLSHLYPDGRSRLYTLYAMAWAIGATLGPLLVTAVLLVGSWRHTYLVIAALLLPALVGIYLLDMPAEFTNERSFGASELPKLARQPAIAVMGVSLILIGGIESVFFTWLPYYAGQFFAERMTNVVLSVYLAAYIPGRYAFSWLADRIANTILMLASSTAVLGVLAVTLLAPGGPPLLVGIFVVGFFVSGFFPTMLAWGTNQYPEYSGPINAIGLTSTQVGFFVFPAIVGVLADVYSIREAMFLQLAVVGGLIVATIVGRWHVATNST